MNKQSLKLSFTKMHGIGNDYIYVCTLPESPEQTEADWCADPERVGSLARLVSDRHFGVGGDGLVLIRPSDYADVMMDMYNSDGSRGKMCGNAIRCVAKYVYERNLLVKPQLDIETLSGVRRIQMQIESGVVQSVTVDMGCPILDPAQIPVCWPGSEMVEAPLEIAGLDWKLTAVSMGNPHVVVFLDNADSVNGSTVAGAFEQTNTFAAENPFGLPDIEQLDLERLGPQFENHPLFPDRINTEFVQVIDRNTLRMRVWERGSGETLACGTGSCASLVAAVITGRCDRSATVRLNGGDLEIEWQEPDGPVRMTGPAAFVFDGQMDVEV